LAGLALGPLPPALLRPVLHLAMTVMRRRHPDVIERLEILDGAEIVIDPVDLPFGFVLRLTAPSPSLVALAKDDCAELAPTATIRGPLLVLIDLLEGRLDGDAAFFSRDLAFEGDTEAVVVLRNAVDSGEIDLTADLLSVLGPLAAPARHALDTAGALFARAARDLDTLSAALLGPATRAAEFRAAEMRALSDDVAELRRTVRRRGPPRDAARDAGGAGT
jgi:predicted lipid carrier protein YhbT